MYKLPRGFLRVRLRLRRGSDEVFVDGTILIFFHCLLEWWWKVGFTRRSGGLGTGVNERLPAKTMRIAAVTRDKIHSGLNFSAPSHIRPLWSDIDWINLPIRLARKTSPNNGGGRISNPVSVRGEEKSSFIYSKWGPNQCLTFTRLTCFHQK